MWIEPGVKGGGDPVYDGRVVSFAGKDGAVLQPALNCFWAKITGSLNTGGNRWRYAWVEQKRNVDVFEDKPNGRSGTTASDYALNTVEAFNTGSGVEGNSIDFDGADFPAGFAMQEVRGDTVVMMAQEPGLNGGSYYSFSYVNAVDGSCG